MTDTGFAQAALDALQESAESTPAAQNIAEANRLRAKIAGVALRMARLQNGDHASDFAEPMLVDARQIEQWEYGESAPSLPDLELLSRCQRGARMPDDLESYRLLRHRMIGVLLRMTRQEADISLDELAARIGMSSETLAACEQGERDSTLPELAAIAQALRADLREFLEPAAFATSGDELAHLADGKADAWRDFATDSENAAFIRLAMAFRHIDADHLHRIADALFAIIRANDADAAS